MKSNKTIITLLSLILLVTILILLHEISTVYEDGSYEIWLLYHQYTGCIPGGLCNK
jgi:hypothetical protein